MPTVNPFDLSGRRVMVTGGSSGIGQAVAVILSRLGATVILVARKADRLQKTVTLLEGKGHTVAAYDLSDYQGIPAWLRTVTGTSGPLDGLVHCAGVYALAPLKVLESSQVETLWCLNVYSHLWLVKGFRQNRVNNDGGSAVLISSAVGIIGQAGLSAYSASKGAIISLMRASAMELAREKIRVNCIAPGNLKTAMIDTIGAPHNPELLATVEKEHPLGFGEPADVAYAAAYLLSPAAKWITGTTLVVDGGYTAH